MHDGAALAAEGRIVFEFFNQSITLSQILCQAGENPEQMVFHHFHDALLRLCTYSLKQTTIVFKLGFGTTRLLLSVQS
jgi:hypothetical protein